MVNRSPGACDNQVKELTSCGDIFKITAVSVVILFWHQTVFPPCGMSSPEMVIIELANHIHPLLRRGTVKSDIVRSDIIAVRTTRLLNIFYFAVNIFTAAAFLAGGQPRQVANPVAATCFYVGLVLLEKHTRFKLKNQLRILLIMTLISHSLIGEYLRAYYDTAFFDNFLHFFGTFTFALLAFELLETFVRIQSSPQKIFAFILVTSLGISLGTLFELLEFSLDILFKQHNQFGPVDTNLDLIFDTLGSILAGVLTAFKAFFPQK